MIKKILLFITIVLFYSFSANASKLEAFVDNNVVTMSDIISLKIKLLGYKIDPKEQPDTSNIEKNFQIIEKSQFQGDEMVDNIKQPKTIWGYSLVPLRSGKLSIDGVELNIRDKKLSIEPLYIEVSAKGQADYIQSDNKLNVEAFSSKNELYIGEAVSYVVKLISKEPIDSAKLEISENRNFVVDKNFVEKKYQIEKNGEFFFVREYIYALIPLYIGQVSLPEVKITGKIVQEQIQEEDGDELSDNLAMNMVSSTAIKLADFSIKTNKIDLNIISLNGDNRKWLPLESLIFEDSWQNSDNIYVGDPLIRTITIKAKGIKGSNIPNIPIFRRDGDYKIYRGKSQVGDDITEAGVTGWRREEFIIIAKKYGLVTIPQIKIPWFNVNKNTFENSFIKEKIVDVLPLSTSDSLMSAQDGKNLNSFSSNFIVSYDKLVDKFIDYKIIVYVLFVFLCCALFFSFRKNTVTITNSNKNFKAAKGVGLDVLRNVTTLHEMQVFIKDFATCYWLAPKNITLKGLSSLIIEQKPALHDSLVPSLFKELERGLYSSKEVDVETLKKIFVKIVKIYSKTVAKQNSKDDNLILNAF